MPTNNATNTPELTLNGQTFIGSTGANPVAATLTGGVGVTIANGAGSITVSSSGGGLTAIDQNATPVTMVAGNNYVADNAGLTTLTLPAVAAFGDTFRITGKGAGGWIMNQAVGQTCHIGNVATTTTTGSIASANLWDAIDILCVTANTTFSVNVRQGNVTIV